MRRIRTLEELVQATIELVTVVSSHAQYLSSRTDIPGDCRKDVEVILFQARGIAGHLAMVPAHLGPSVVQKHSDDSEPTSGGMK